MLFVLPPRDGGIGSGGGVLQGRGGGAGQEQGPEEQVQAEDVGGEVGRPGTYVLKNSQKMCHAIFCFLLSREGLPLSVAAAAAASPPLVPASAPAPAGSDASPPGGGRGASR